MNIISAIILGVVEGATEFLPVSSSGHLIIARQLLHLSEQGTLAFDAVLQFAAAIALTIYFWADIERLIITFFNIIRNKITSPVQRTLIWAIVLGTVPAVVFGLLLQTYMDTVFRNVHLVGLMLLLGSGLMFWAQRKSKVQSRKSVQLENEGGELTVWKGIQVGLYQCLALVPGVSRSGATISGGLLSGLSRDEAVRFSFLLSVPVLLGSGAKELYSARHALTSAGLAPLILGSVASFIVALLAIHYFIRFLKGHNLNVFIWYRVVLSIAIFFLL